MFLVWFVEEKGTTGLLSFILIMDVIGFVIVIIIVMDVIVNVVIMSVIVIMIIMDVIVIMIMIRCSRCRGPRYCSRECQTQHWAQHKQVCKKN